MPLPLPNLDDRRFDDLLEEARGLIPTLYPTWTDHNPTDPGIVLLELLAWLTEMVIYRVNRVPPASYITFLRLLNGPAWTLDGDLDGAIRDTVQQLRTRFRAATCEDYEQLVIWQWPLSPEAQALGEEGRVQRARCVPRRNLPATGPLQSAPGHVSLIVVPDAPDDPEPQPSEALRQGLWTWLDSRRLLTTQHHVVGPVYLQVAVSARLHLHEDAATQANHWRTEAARVVRAFFHPLTGGQDGRGWPFGRDLFVSEVYQLLEEVGGVNYVEDVTLVPATPDSGREQRASDGSLIGVTLLPHELAVVDVSADSFLMG